MIPVNWCGIVILITKKEIDTLFMTKKFCQIGKLVNDSKNGCIFTSMRPSKKHGLALVTASEAIKPWRVSRYLAPSPLSGLHPYHSCFSGIPKETLYTSLVS